MERYYYSAVVLAIHDGDTLTLDIDLGFKTRQEHKIRLYGLNCPELEINKLPNPSGLEALNFTKSKLQIGDSVFVKTIKDKEEKFGRTLGVVFYPNPALVGTFLCLNEQLLTNNLASPYMQSKAKYW